LNQRANGKMQDAIPLEHSSAPVYVLTLLVYS
jgi:hypothetical protein